MLAVGALRRHSHKNCERQEAADHRAAGRSAFGSPLGASAGGQA